MVVIASPQPNELEQKKRKQTLERAKANHLSKQLQMRLQYAKLKVEHGWQRQNLNEVENLYFHHSHLRTLSLRQGAMRQQPHHATVAPAQVDPAPSAVPDRTVPPSPAVNDPCPSDAASPPSQSPSDHTPTADGRPLSQPSSQLPLQTPTPVLPSSAPATNRPPSAIDLSDPNILARLAQLQAQVQMSTQPSSQTHPPSTTVPPSTTTSASQPISVPTPNPGVFPPHAHPAVTHAPSSVAYAIYASQPPLGTSAPLYSPAPTSATPHNPGIASQPLPVTAPIPTPTPITSSALTYDSFWSTHASSTGPTRALYRTHTGFTASAGPGGNVAMLTPGGHAAVMTAEGVYVGGSSKSG